MIKFISWKQCGHIKYPCILCIWESCARDEFWVTNEWPTRSDLTVGKTNIINNPVVPREKIEVPSHHIKLDLIRQFVKTLPVEGRCFNYLCRLFSQMNKEKLIAREFNGPQI